jgi:hypothetical protein
VFGSETDLNGVHLRGAITGDKMALACDVDNETPPRHDRLVSME